MGQMEGQGEEVVRRGDGARDYVVEFRGCRARFAANDGDSVDGEASSDGMKELGAQATWFDERDRLAITTPGSPAPLPISIQSPGLARRKSWAESRR